MTYTISLTTPVCERYQPAKTKDITRYWKAMLAQNIAAITNYIESIYVIIGTIPPYNHTLVTMHSHGSANTMYLLCVLKMIILRLMIFVERFADQVVLSSQPGDSLTG